MCDPMMNDGWGDVDYTIPNTVCTDDVEDRFTNTDVDSKQNWIKRKWNGLKSKYLSENNENGKCSEMFSCPAVVDDSLEWENPLRLIECIMDNGKYKLQLNRKTAKLMEEIQKPMVVVVIAGPYRTGKSYLMNRLAGKPAGFALGATVCSKTKGIWAWKIKHPIDDGKWLLIMDTEGLGDVSKGDTAYDTSICCLSLLLSSVFVYNDFGSMQNKVLENLAFTADMVRHIGEKYTDFNLQTSQTSPMFILALRDHCLQMKNRDGKYITEDEFLEEMLTLDVGQEQQKHIREKIRSYFTKRKCFCFMRPVFEERDLQTLGQCDEVSLRSCFEKKSNEFCNEIFNKAPVKKIVPFQHLSGEGFIQLVNGCLKAIDNGTIPHIDALDQFMKIAINENAMKTSVDLYEKEFRATPFPMAFDKFIKHHSDCFRTANTKFNKLSYHDTDQAYLTRFLKRIKNKSVKLADENMTASDAKCRREIECLFNEIGDEIKSFQETGNYEEYKKTLHTLQKKYFNIDNLGPSAEYTWLSKLNDLEEKEESQIIGKKDMIHKKQMQDYNNDLDNMEKRAKVGVVGGGVATAGALLSTPLIAASTVGGISSLTAGALLGALPVTAPIVVGAATVIAISAFAKRSLRFVRRFKQSHDKPKQE